MQDADKTPQQLIQELGALRQAHAALESCMAKRTAERHQLERELLEAV